MTLSIFSYPVKTLLTLLTIVCLLTSCSNDDDNLEQFVGTWAGVSDDPEAPGNFDILDNIVFQLPVVDQRSGTWTYNIVANENCDSNVWNCDFTLSCTGSLFYKEKIDNTYFFEETLSTGDCVEGGVGEFEFMDDNTLKYRFVFSQSFTRTATLFRTQ